MGDVRKQPRRRKGPDQVPKQRHPRGPMKGHGARSKPLERGETVSSEARHPRADEGIERLSKLLRVVVNASGAPVLWRVNEDGFLRSSILNGTTMWFLQGADGLVVPDHFLPLGQNYFLIPFPLPPAGYQGATCEQKVDPCASGPCHNNGTCYAQGPGPLGFGCSCTAGFTGPTCAQLVDFCALNPCAHGVCRSVGNSYRCLCVPGYHGLYCEEEYNECLSAPCQNYATCKDLVNAYECVCTTQFEGRHCEIYKDPCLKMRCQNGGRCESEGLNVSCSCQPGYLGEKCEVDVNECESSPCHHGGTCVDQSNGFTCHCPPGWVGPSCEIHLQWKPAHTEDTLTNMPRHSLYIIIGALCVAFVLMLIILIVGICRISRIEYQGSSRHAYQEFYNCRSIDSEFSNAIASIRHARFGKKAKPAMYDATPIAYEDYSPDDKPLVTLIKTKDL
ncbi:delta and Notch-like epidermal growth factor-related receptor [Notothenia coriiceps]|uniref:Delta and Notch-like epidermal growth factor-related receptor n=1 Tax=Notothenia coriiceps TaxID=8208 RepID=A0A6I9Q3Q9_9TELE|nr:PREDICTED: delta and Notch-like epidermal growth factor-related receptor [Notothenia coriiceps]